MYFSISLETDLSKLIKARTEDFREKVKKEREKLSTDIKAFIGEKCVKGEYYKQLNEVKSALMNHSRFVDDVFHQKKNPKNIWKAESQAVLSQVLSKADSLSEKVVELESLLASSGPCDHLTVGGLEAEMRELSERVGGFVMQNLKIVNFLPRRIEALERKTRQLEDEWVERKKGEEIC